MVSHTMLSGPVQKYLLHVQRENLAAVNEAVNQLCLEEEDYKSLRESIDVYDQFDQVTLICSRFVAVSRQ